MSRRGRENSSLIETLELCNETAPGGQEDALRFGGGYLMVEGEEGVSVGLTNQIAIIWPGVALISRNKAG